MNEEEIIEEAKLDLQITRKADGTEFQVLSCPSNCTDLCTSYLKTNQQLLYCYDAKNCPIKALAVAASALVAVCQEGSAAHVGATAVVDGFLISKNRKIGQFLGRQPITK